MYNLCIYPQILLIILCITCLLIFYNMTYEVRLYDI